MSLLASTVHKYRWTNECADGKNKSQDPVEELTEPKHSQYRDDQEMTGARKDAMPYGKAPHSNQERNKRSK